MPALTPISETTEALSVVSEEIATVHLGFFPGVGLSTAPYPFPSSTSYPGDTYSTGLFLTTLSED